MYTITTNLSPEETEESWLRKWFTVGPFEVTFIEIVRHEEETPRNVVAYILREPKQRKGKSDVVIVFLKAYDFRRLEGHVYREQERPLAFDCPCSILQRLSPTSDAEAIAWRDQCWQRVYRPLHHKDTITFTVEVPTLPVPPGTPLDVELSAGSRPLFRDKQGQPYRIPFWYMYPYRFLSAPLR